MFGSNNNTNVRRRKKSIIEEATEAAKETAKALHDFSYFHDLSYFHHRAFRINNKTTNSHSHNHVISRHNTLRHGNGGMCAASHQDAMDRGSARGMSEAADGINKGGKSKEEVRSSGGHPHPQEQYQGPNYYERNIEKEENVGNVSSFLSITKKKFRAKKKMKNDYSSFDSDDPLIILSKSKEATKNASMCAFCGSIFSNEAYASYHEYSCIRRGIADVAPSSASASDTATMVSVGDAAPSKEVIKMSDPMKKYIIMSDEALIKVVRRAQKYSLSKKELDSERELALMARDRSFLDMRAIASLELKYQPSKKQGRGGVNKLWNRLQDKFSYAYAMIKEGDDPDNDRVDKYHQKRSDGNVKHGRDTLYVNIIVKHSARLINNELDRIFQERWKMISAAEKEHKNNFEFLRHKAHVQALQLVKFALSPDVKPEKVAIQLSNDICRLISPQAKLCGVEIETDIDYRKGPFFILGVNVIAIDWIIVMRYFNQKVQERKLEWTESVRSLEDANAETTSWQFMLNDIFRMTKLEIVEQLLALLNNISWVISVPLLCALYQCFLKATIQRLIITGVTGDFFKYAEGQGMEMDLEVKHAQQQIAFMLDALHQIRKEEHDLDKKKTEATEGEDIAIRGPLLGPLIDLDGQDSDTPPKDLEAPKNLEFVAFKSDLPVGYRRLRRAFLFDATFIEEALYLDTLNYTEIESGPWDRHEGEIGEVENAEDVDENSFIGAKKNTRYLMPRSAFVKANVAYEEAEIIAYNEYFFSLKKKTINPDVPFGHTFCAWTQITVHNLGNNNCCMECSVEADFPNGAPIVARNIKSAMRQGVTEVFLELGKTVCKYASVLPTSK